MARATWRSVPRRSARTRARRPLPATSITTEHDWGNLSDRPDGSRLHAMGAARYVLELIDGLAFNERVQAGLDQPAETDPWPEPALNLRSAEIARRWQSTFAA